MEKICSRCRNKKDIGEFFKDKSRKDGFNCYCKQCVLIINSARHKKNPDKRRAELRKYRYENKDKIRATREKWVKNNIEKVRGYGRIYRQRNPSKIKEENKISVIEMKPHYIRRLIGAQYDIPSNEISDDIIEAKRRQLKYYRQLKQLKQQAK